MLLPLCLCWVAAFDWSPHLSVSYSNLLQASQGPSLCPVSVPALVSYWIFPFVLLLVFLQKHVGLQLLSSGNPEATHISGPHPSISLCPRELCGGCIFTPAYTLKPNSRRGEGAGITFFPNPNMLLYKICSFPLFDAARLDFCLDPLNFPLLWGSLISGLTPLAFFI